MPCIQSTYKILITLCYICDCYTHLDSIWLNICSTNTFWGAPRQYLLSCQIHHGVSQRMYNHIGPLYYKILWYQHRFLLLPCVWPEEDSCSTTHLKDSQVSLNWMTSLVPLLSMPSLFPEHWPPKIGQFSPSILVDPLKISEFGMLYFVSQNTRFKTIFKNQFNELVIWKPRKMMKNWGNKTSLTIY